MNKRFRLDFLMLTVFCFLCTMILYSCKSEPSDLGLNFIDPNDTTGTFILDSQADTMTITGSNYRTAINTFGSEYMMIGAIEGYEAKSFVKYNNIPSDLDSASVLSSTFYLQYGDFAFKDSNASVSFNVYRVNRDLSYPTVTWDSIQPSDIGTKLLGTYTGVPLDTVTLAITLDNQLVKDWLEYSADTNYPVKNYGLAFVPNASSGTIKGFFSSETVDDPYIQTIVSKNGETDTLIFNSSISLWLANAPSSIIPPDRFVLQNGVAYNELMGFDLSKLPPNVIINEALITLTLDTSSSYLTNQSDRRLRIAFTTDSVRKTDTSVAAEFSFTPVNGVYEIRVNNFFQLWANGTFPNYGILIGNAGQYGNFDKFVFYSSTYSDLTKVPRLRIRYTPRLP